MIKAVVNQNAKAYNIKQRRGKNMSEKTSKEKVVIKEPYGDIDLQMFKEFTEADGISGNEKEASRVMKKWLEGYVDSIQYDNLGSIIGVKKGSGSGLKLMLAGHIDEIGFVIKDIDDNGFIKVNTIGGWWGHVLPAQPVTITTREGKKFHGIFGAAAPHGLPAEARSKVMEIKDMFIDMGVGSKEELTELGIRVGDMVTPRSSFEVMNNPNFLVAKAWDDRVGALIAVDVIRKLKGVDHDFDIYAAGTVQEEVVLRGAKTAAYAIKPDLAIALDVTIASDYPAGENRIKCGLGVTVELFDASHLGHRGFIQYIEDICKEKGIEFQLEQLTAGGTDSGEINKSYEGIINVTMSIPSRYCHSHHTIIHRKDYVDTVNVIVELCKRMNSEQLEKIRTYNR